MLSITLSLLVAAALWISVLQFFFSPAGDKLGSIPSDARAMAGRQLEFWNAPVLKDRELTAMRQSNAEWDFMGRTFLALALCEMCERDATLKSDYLPVVDKIIDETISLENECGMHFFLMSYSRTRPYRVQPERSLFLDGEIALMLAARRMVEEKPAYKEPMTARLKIMEERLRSGASMAVESYPDECWIFDHSIALAAIRLGDFLDGADHTTLFRDWSRTARSRLVHKESGLLVSAYDTNNVWMEGPEGSSIWAAVHFIRLFDPALAAEQYTLARRQLGRTLLGFGWSREWPATWRNHVDIDSGVVIPVVDAGAAASGLALIASASFADSEYLRSLRASLNFAAFPVRKNGSLRYCASNAVGDAAMLYAMTLGTLWEKVNRPHL